MLGKKSIIVSNWFTIGSPYEAVAHRNALTFEKAKSRPSSIGVEGTDDWAQNCNLKPGVCVSLIDTLDPGEGALLLDADATVEGLIPWREITGRTGEGPGFAYVLHIRPSGAREVLSGTLWLTNTPECRALVRKWAAKVAEHPLDWDQRSLGKVLGGHVSPMGGRQVRELDWHWAWIEGITDRPREQAWIVHHQMSRQTKEKPSEDKAPPEQAPPEAQEQPKKRGKKAAGSPVEKSAGSPEPELGDNQ